MRRVLASKQLSASAKNLALALMMHHNQTTGQCNPKQSTLATSLGVGRTYINQLVAKLEGAGWIKAFRTRSASLYRLELDHVEASEACPASANDNTRCLQLPTSDVGNCRHLDVHNGGHLDVHSCRQRTTKGISHQNAPKNDPLLPPAPVVVGAISEDRQSGPSSPRLPQAQDGMSFDETQSKPETVIYHSISFDLAQIKEWSEMFRLIRVEPEVRQLARWASEKKMKPERAVGVIERQLNMKNEKADREAKDRAAKAEAEARVFAAQAKPVIRRPAI